MANTWFHIIPSPAPNVDNLRLNAILAGKLAGRAAHFVLSFVLAQRLGVAAFGLYALGYTLFKLLGTALVPLGLPNAVLRYGADGDLRVHRRALGLAAGSVALWGVGLGLLARPIAGGVFGEPGLAGVLLAFALGLPGLALLETGGASARALRRVDVAVWAGDIVQPVLALGLVLVWPGLTATGAAFILAATFTVAAVPPLWVALRRPVVPPPAPVPALLPYALVAMLYMTLTRGIQWLDRLLVGVLFTVADVGQYQAASQLSMVFSMIITAEGTILAPQLSRQFTAGDRDAMQATYQAANLWGFRLSVAFYLLVLASPALLLGLTYGPAYLGAAPLLVIMATGQLANGVTGACATLMLVTAQQRRLTIIYAGALALNIALSVALARPLGVAGVAAGTGIALTLAMVAMVYSNRQALGIVPMNGQFWPPVLAGGAGVLALGGVAWWGGAPYRVVLGLALALVAGLWALYPDLRRLVAGRAR